VIEKISAPDPTIRVSSVFEAVDFISFRSKSDTFRGLFHHIAVCVTLNVSLCLVLNGKDTVLNGKETYSLEFSSMMGEDAGYSTVNGERGQPRTSAPGVSNAGHPWRLCGSKNVPIL
jgi:hypothetical protein